ncbi:hypothetical protein ACFVHB_18975 [Kitasatospora sp. NPDC127111]|uniref:hypothetical protein n=1 Tax=Kitasatospora sp. NPDC127111 TaxID=3345363 RepID=UPI00362D1C1F
MASGSSTGGAGGGEFVIKPWELHGEGREFEKISEDFGKAVGTLEQGLAALGSPWGLDQPGSGFAAVYKDAHGGVLGGLRGLAGRLGQVGSGLHTMAERTADADTTAASGFGPAAGPRGPLRPGATPAAGKTVPKDVSA